MDIHSKAEGLAGQLSNLERRPFVLDGTMCGSMEGFLQSLKIEDREKQELMCNMVGKFARQAGQQYNEIWKSSQTLWWRGAAMKRDCDELQYLITRVYDRMAEFNPDFVSALLATGDEELTHRIGNPDPTETVLTEAEFIGQLYRLRGIYQNKEKQDA